MMKKNNSNTIYKIKDILRDKEKFKVFYTDSEFENFMLSILKDERFSIQARAEIAFDDLYKIVNLNDSSADSILINSKNDLQSVLLACLSKSIEESNEFNSQVYSIYLKNIEDIEPQTRIIKITKEANSIMKNFIIENPTEYLKKYLLRKHGPSFGHFYVFDPFASYYFDNWNSFESFLQNINTGKVLNNNEDEVKFRNTLQLAFEKFKKTGYKEFELDEAEVKIISKFIL